ncbi:solute carrier family 35 member E1 homolog [Ixodes scapularis]|uniref:Putative solute carrier family 35 member e1 log-like protein n=1 Tax=Ixodes scapularis TaxID=6945 RepID=A0A4D5S0S8_IXOSC|nr:solute carrier family 35 member E1 homolog [Ixodes scapularis]
MVAAPSTSSGEIFRVVLLCVLWYGISSGNNVVGKVVLTHFPFPLTVTMVQLFSITVLSGPAFAIWGIRPYLDLPWTKYMTSIVPLACGKFVSSLMSHVSLWKVPVSYAHTVKATMPLFTVVLSRIILKEKHSCTVYLSLLPIIAGVMVATVTEISFDAMGLVCALISTVGFALQNIYTKKVIRDTKLHYLRLLHTFARLALTFFIPVWLLVDVRSFARGPALFPQGDAMFVLLLLFLDGALSFCQNLVAFTVLNLVSPLTYSVCNATKRISVITVSLLLLHNPVTLLNVLGMLTAVLGVLCYNKAKYDANKAEHAAEAKLPTSTRDLNPLLESLNHRPKVANGVNGGGLHLFTPYHDKPTGV